MKREQITTLYTQHGHPLFRVCLDLSSDYVDAQDLLLAVFNEVSKSSGSPDFARLRSEAERLSGHTVGPEALSDALLSRYLANTVSNSERNEVEAMLSGGASAQVRLAMARSERAAFYVATPAETFAERVVPGAEAPSTAERPRGATPRRGAMPKWPIAVGVILVAIIAGVIWPRSEPKPEPTPAAAPDPAPASEPPRAPEPASEPASIPTPAVAASPAPIPASTTAVAPSGERMMATFDFGETLGRVSFYEGRSREKSVPSGTSVQIRANIPEPGNAGALVSAPDGKTFRPLGPTTKVQPKWRVLGRTTVDRSLSLLVVFSPDSFVATSLTNEPLDIERQARINITLSED